MELANLWVAQHGVPDGIRVAVKSDAGAILQLLQTAVYTHLHADWHLPGDWIGAPGFIVVPKPERTTNSNSLTAVLFQKQGDMVACLAATPDPLPAAWVRVAAIGQAEKGEALLAQMMALAVPALQKQGVTQLAWLTVDPWPNPWLPELGFYRGSQIETFVKEDHKLPEVADVPGLTIRQVYSTDFAALEELEGVSFAPIWRQSAHALAVARPQSLSFDVALLDDEIVAYQLSAPSDTGAHLVRLTVHPEKHGLGIGSALLKHALEYYHRKGYYAVSLNTQVENIASQKLYLKFGFAPSQQRLPIWILDIPQ
ncbi:MAG: GNAT family N-acetyltransferase [Ardenticatenaceae bacterium]|nr:GNAT family N-acetyltransferase [Ardenticatenaceae bacterium]